MTSPPPLNRDGEPRAFFGRRAGKSLHERQKRLVDDLLPRLEIVLPVQAVLDPDSLFDPVPRDVMLEIGYGGGEHLVRQASENPDIGFIGAEPFSGGIGKILEKIDQGGLTNVRLYSDDALKLLQVLPAASLGGVYLLYPDPWPKTRHHKRRFISPMTLAELARTIRAGGFFRFATDIEDYANWALAHILREPRFEWPQLPPAAWHVPFDGWQPTRYEQKARHQGRLQSFYFTFWRRQTPA